MEGGGVGGYFLAHGILTQSNTLEIYKYCMHTNTHANAVCVIFFFLGERGGGRWGRIPPHIPTHTPYKSICAKQCRARTQLGTPSHPIHTRTHIRRNVSIGIRAHKNKKHTRTWQCSRPSLDRSAHGWRRLVGSRSSASHHRAHLHGVMPPPPHNTPRCSVDTRANLFANTRIGALVSLGDGLCILCVIFVTFVYVRNVVATYVFMSSNIFTQTTRMFYVMLVCVRNASMGHT